MRLGIVTHKLVKGDGQGRVNYEVARAMADRGHEVVLLASEVSPDLATHPAVTWARFPVAGWPTELVRNQVFAIRSTAWLWKHQTSLDLVLANGCITWSPVDVNAVHFVHGTWMCSPVHTSRLRPGPYGWYQWVYTALNATWERLAFKQAKAIVAVSNQVRDELLDIGVSPDVIRVITNGVDLDEFSPGRASREALDLPVGEVLGVFIGDIRTPRKNLDTVLRAMQLVPMMHLAVVGATDGSPYPEMARRLRIADRVHFLGYRRDVPEIMRAADLCLCPSRHEPFSLVLIEALASGLPVITARCVGAAQLVSPGSGFVLADPEDVNGLAAAMSRLVEEPGLREQMGKEARVVAVQHSWRVMAQHYVNLFEYMATHTERAPAVQRREYAFTRR